MTRPIHTTAAFMPQSDSVAIFGLSPEIVMMELPRAMAEQLHAALGTALHAPKLAKQQADMFAVVEAEEADAAPTLPNVQRALRNAQRCLTAAQEDVQSGRPELRNHAPLSCIRAAAACQHAAALADRMAALNSIQQEEPLP